MFVELGVLDGQERGDHRLGHEAHVDRLAVLALEEGDLVAGRVVHVGALGEIAERRQRDRQLLVGMHRLDDPRHHSDGHRSETETGHGDDEGQLEQPGDAMHNAVEASGGAPSDPITLGSAACTVTA